MENSKGYALNRLEFSHKVMNHRYLCGKSASKELI